MIIGESLLEVDLYECDEVDEIFATFWMRVLAA